MNQDGYEYDVAVSCAGADREMAGVIVSIAKANGLRVFLDEEHLWESWGKNLNEYLGEVYDRQARFCLILISRDYCERAYTNLERRRALDRALESKVEYILPVRLDDSWLEGLPRATAYLDLRAMSLLEVGETLVRKIKGADVRVIVPEGIEASKVVPLSPSEGDAPLVRRGTHTNQPIDFVAIQVAEECKRWKLDEQPYDGFPGLFFNGRDSINDPIFDITIMSRHDKPVLLTAVGIQAVRLSQGGCLILGGGGGEPLNLHRTYKLPLPDLLQSLAEKQRALGIGWGEAVDVDELAYCRLPDPILIESYRPYRYGLHLFDYVNYCPTEVELFFWARTDRGEARSERARLTFVIGSEIPPLSRYRRLLSGEEEAKEQQEDKLRHLWPEDKKQMLQRLAHELWERAGRPQGRDQELWSLAEKELPARILGEDALRMVHKRPI
jgi:TIR domain/Protein of unknown function (DUF2934)